MSMLTGCSSEDILNGFSGNNEKETVQEDGSSQAHADEKKSVWEQGSMLRGDDLSFDEFLKELFVDSASSDTMTLHFFLSDPESYGITPGPITFGDYGYKDKESSLKSLEDCRYFLDKFRKTGLDREQQISADILEAYLNNCEKNLELEYYYEPLKAGMGLQAGIPYSMAEYTFYKKQDVEDYLELLTQVGDYYKQVIDWERQKAAEGLFMTDELLDMVIEECRVYQWNGEEEYFLHETFKERLDELPELSEAEKQDYVDREIQILKNEFYEAYEILIKGLEDLRGKGTNDKGLYYFSKGQKYYEYLIESNIGMTYSGVDELYTVLSQEIQDIYDEMYDLFARDDTLWDRWNDNPEDDRNPDEMLEDLNLRIQEDFPQGPDSRYEVKKVSKSMENYMNPAFYMIPPIDRYTENVIYINEKELEGNYNIYATLAHEGYPGHLYQNTYFCDKNNTEFRKMLDFTGYTEGWGLYAEYYSYRWMDQISQEEQILNCLSERLNIVTSALLDVGINYYGWTREDAAQICESIIGTKSEQIIEQVYPYMINDPAGYLDYYVGYLEISQMAKEAELALGNNFDIKEFHEFLLDFGPAPFTVIQPYFQEWMDSYGFENKFPDIEYNPIMVYGRRLVS